MWLFICAIIIAGIACFAFIVKKASEASKEEEAKQIELRRQAEAEAKRKKNEILTDAELQDVANDKEQDADTCAFMFEKAVHGNVEAMTYMGYIYRLSIKNPQKSVYWFEKAAGLGSSDALYWLGSYYIDGYGVPMDRMKGVGYITDAARAGSQYAIDSLKKDFGLSVSEIRSMGIKA